jgi:hypothetical protein
VDTVHEFFTILTLRLQRDELLQVIVIERVGLAKIAAGGLTQVPQQLCLGDGTRNALLALVPRASVNGH